jgi:hypothetical protein
MRILKHSFHLPFFTLLLGAGVGCFGDPETVEIAGTTSALNPAAIHGGVPADYDGDGVTDIAIRPANTGVWSIDGSRDGFFGFDEEYRGYGSAAPVPADYDGDGRADLSVKDGGVWLINYSRNGFDDGWEVQLLGYGTTTVPVPADYDNDRHADLAVLDAEGTWFIDLAEGGFGSWNRIFPDHGGVGGAGAVPVPADYDGDGLLDLAVKDDLGNWQIDFASNGFEDGFDVSFPNFGDASFRPAPADFDGDRKADLATKDGNGNWHITFSLNGVVATYPGYGATSFPMPADYNGDGKADLSVRDPDSQFWFIDFAPVFGAWNRILPLFPPAEPAISLQSALRTSLRVRVQANIVTERIETMILDDTCTEELVMAPRVTLGQTATETFGNLDPDTLYCIRASAINNAGVATRFLRFSTRPDPLPQP